MSIISKFRDAASGALNWAFNNNCQVIDPTRLRITDGTPLHSTGLRRLFNNIQIVGSIGIVTAATALEIAFNSKDDASNLLLINTIHGASGFLLASLLSNFLFSILNGFDVHKKCFLTEPDFKNTNVLKMDTFNIKTTKYVYLALSLYPLLQMIFKDHGYDRKGLDLLSSHSTIEPIISLVYGLNFWRFKKVTDGKWTIDDVSPPQKGKKLEEKAEEALKSMLPAPTPQPAPA